MNSAVSAQAGGNPSDPVIKHLSISPHAGNAVKESLAFTSVHDITKWAREYS